MSFFLRLSELLFCFILLATLSIPSIIIAIFIKIESKGPVLHWSKSIGIENKYFLMPKFRTMILNTPQVASNLLEEDMYLTKVGSILRKFSLDEVPQLLSIISGQMTFVGPRPALYNQDDLIKLRTANNIHMIKPGITGWAQINGRDNISIEKKVKLEIDYLNNKSIILDIKILFITIFRVILSKDISH